MNIRRTNEKKEFCAFCSTAIAERSIYQEWKIKNPIYFENKISWIGKTFEELFKDGLFTRTSFQHYKAGYLY